MKRLFLIGLGMATLGASASANFALVGRYSEVQAKYFIGYAGDLFEATSSLTEATLDVADTTTVADSFTGSGYYPPTNNNWTGTSTWNVTQSYALTGTAASASKLVSTGSVFNDITSVGCTAETSSLQPGNLSRMDIQLSSAQDLRFKGTLESDLPANLVTSVIYGYQWNGSGWSTFLVKFPNSSWDQVLSLAPGTYRFEALATAKASTNEFKESSWSYSLEAVPEPGTMAVLGMGALALIKRRKKK